MTHFNEELFTKVRNKEELYRNMETMILAPAPLISFAFLIISWVLLIQSATLISGAAAAALMNPSLIFHHTFPALSFYFLHSR